MSMNLKMWFEIRRSVSNEKIAFVEADSFKEAIKEFASSYDFNDTDKYTAISDGNKIEFRFVLPASIPGKGRLSYKEDDLFEIYLKNTKLYVTLSKAVGGL